MPGLQEEYSHHKDASTPGDKHMKLGISVAPQICLQHTGGNTSHQEAKFLGDENKTKQNTSVYS